MNEHPINTGSEKSGGENVKQLVGFSIGSETFGVDILMVREIIRKMPITAIPDSPDFIEGVVNLRGNIIPVIDLRKRLKLVKNPELNDDIWIVILDIGGRVTGFIVDNVSKVIKAPVSSIKPPPDIVAAGLKSQYIHGVCKLEDQLLILLDFRRVLMVEEIKKLRAIKRSSKTATA